MVGPRRAVVTETNEIKFHIFGPQTNGSVIDRDVWYSPGSSPFRIGDPVVEFWDSAPRQAGVAWAGNRFVREDDLTAEELALVPPLAWC